MLTTVTYSALGLLGTCLAAVSGSYLWSITHPHTITTTHELTGSPEAVWQVLDDNARYPEWNPSIVHSEGDFVVGQRVHNIVESPTGTLDFRPRVLVVEPGRELRWRGQFLAPGIADGEHFFLIEDLGGGRVRLTQGETFTGALVPFAGQALAMEDEFAKVNMALGKRVGDLAAVESSR